MYLNGGWSYVWQGNKEELYPQEKNTLYEALQLQYGNDNVEYVEGVTTNSIIDIDEAVKAAEKADVIIASLGEEPYCETPGNIKDLTLDEAQLELIDELSKTGKPIVLVLYQGRPRLISKIVDKVDAVVLGMLPGLEGADATVDIISGKVNPSAKLPFTYPKYPAGNTTYDHKPIEAYEDVWSFPQWNFGYGLSYTSYSYENLEVSNADSINDTIKVSVEVSNTGDREGKEIVELYIRDVYGSVSRPVKQLKGFQKIDLKPGEKKTVNFILTPDQLSFHNRENIKTIEPGEFWIMIENLTQKIILN